MPSESKRRNPLHPRNAAKDTIAQSSRLSVPESGLRITKDLPALPTDRAKEPEHSLPLGCRGKPRRGQRSTRGQAGGHAGAASHNALIALLTLRHGFVRRGNVLPAPICRLHTSAVVQIAAPLILAVSLPGVAGRTCGASAALTMIVGIRSQLSDSRSASLRRSAFPLGVIGNASSTKNFRGIM